MGNARVPRNVTLYCAPVNCPKDLIQYAEEIVREMSTVKVKRICTFTRRSRRNFTVVSERFVSGFFRFCTWTKPEPAFRFSNWPSVVASLPGANNTRYPKRTTTTIDVGRNPGQLSLPRHHPWTTAFLSPTRPCYVVSSLTGPTPSRTSDFATCSSNG